MGPVPRTSPRSGEGPNIVKEKPQPCGVVRLERKQGQEVRKGNKGEETRGGLSPSSSVPDSQVLTRQSLTPFLALPKAVRDGFARGEAEGPQLGGEIKIAARKDSFWSLAMPV